MRRIIRYLLLTILLLININAFSQDDDDFYFHKGFAGLYAIVRSKKINGQWTPPETVSFTSRYSDAEPHLSYDGSKIVFSSNRPLDGKGEPLSDKNIWIAERFGEDWQEPRPFGFAVNTESNELHPVFSSTNDLYFCSTRDDDLDIFVSQYKNGKYLNPQKLDAAVNSPFGDGDAYPAPDGSFLIFISYNRPECYGNADLYISFQNEDGTWSKSKNMGPKINTKFREVDPVISFDSKYLFFRSNRINSTIYSEKPLNYNEILKITNSPGNGKGDIYWVDLKIIEELR